ncbi:MULTISPECIES: Spy/CpxP family protein refolding chaperone [unclassified Variovorax]|uniref:Spy/CpxP family protein refolding chaperone n=1 Tax=unclassified Variovorax TaxID=663243 RepID=UPI002576846C|nr:MULTISPECIES: Spy/CpxP family protein refolding chaperone [unclassified Variovorax]MDM0090830.1 Spy/CpxP family protein refolding chaperone [Variovorax sp. J22G40]MDM0149168.1 Spy/CpxP family protein refolding chaperone [Variovorax sp. J2P1-31]
MITARQRILWASLLASATFAAAAQTPPPAAPAGPEARTEQRAHKPRDGKFFERMQERRVKHLADLKAKLKLSAAQEGAWTTFTTATQPPAPPAARADREAARAEFAKLTTPQRLDRMQARQSERAARFAQRADATRTFYAALTPEQQKTFDTEALKHGPRGHGHRGHGPDGHRAPPPAPKG